MSNTLLVKRQAKLQDMSDISSIELASKKKVNYSNFLNILLFDIGINLRCHGRAVSSSILINGYQQMLDN